MANGRDAREVKLIRNEVLMALRVTYPAAMQMRTLMRTLVVLFPTIEFAHLRCDLHYLLQKDYVERVAPDLERDTDLTPWRQRWFRLTPGGMDLADRCLQNPALEE